MPYFKPTERMKKELKEVPESIHFTPIYSLIQDRVENEGLTAEQLTKEIEDELIRVMKKLENEETKTVTGECFNCSSFLYYEEIHKCKDPNEPRVRTEMDDVMDRECDFILSKLERLL